MLQSFLSQSIFKKLWHLCIMWPSNKKRSATKTHESEITLKTWNYLLKSSKGPRPRKKGGQLQQRVVTLKFSF